MSTQTTAGAVPQFTLQDRLRKAREYAGLDQQELMRHESVTSTQMYTRVTDDERRKAVGRLVA